MKPDVGVLLMAHGTPRSLDGLEAFYTEIRRGRPPSGAQLEDLRRRYLAIGGTSPLNATTAAQGTGVAAALEAMAPGRWAVEVGTRFADPRIEEAAARLGGIGVRTVVGLVLAPHSSQVSVAQYAQRAATALQATTVTDFRMVDHWYDAPGFADLVAARVTEAVIRAGGEPGDTPVVFSAHSVPTAVVAAGDTYPEQVEESARAVAAAAGLGHWQVAWQSAGRTDDPWLGPDIGQVIATLGSQGERRVVVCPIGFVTDHLEILYDVDIEAAAVAGDHGMRLVRTTSFNDDALFCRLVAQVVTDHT